MPVRGVKVGDAFFEVKYDVDTASALAEMKAFNAAAGRMANIDARINTQGLLRSRATFREAANALGGEFTDGFNSRTATLGDAIARNTERQRRTNQQFEREGNSAARAFTQEADRMFRDAVAKGVGLPGFDTKKMTQHIEKDVDRDSRGWGLRMGSNMMNGISSTLSLLPGRLEGIFTSTGPVGLALLAGLVAAATAAAPLIGAIISGALFAAIGGGVVVAGIALVAKDPRVKAAAGKLKDMFTKEIFNGKGAEAFVKAVVPALNMVTKALERWSPLINQMLVGASKFVGPITQGLIKFVDALLPALNALMNSAFMKDLMTVLKEGLAGLGDALASIIQSFLSNPQAMAGAVKGLRVAFMILIGALITTGKVLAWLSATFFEVTEWFKRLPQYIQNARHWLEALWQTITGFAATVGSALVGAWNTLAASTSAAWQAIYNVIIGAVMGIWNTIIGVWGAIVNFVVGAWNSIYAGVSSALIATWNFIVGVWNAVYGFLVGILGAIWAWVSGVWNNVYNAVASALMATWNFIVGVWNAVYGFLVGVLQAIWAWVVGVWNNIYGGVANVLTAIWNFVVGVWNSIYGFIQQVIVAIGNWIVTGWNAIWAGVANILNAIGTFIVGTWNAIYHFIQVIIVAIGNWIVSGWNAIWNGVTNILNAIGSFIVGTWNAIYSFIRNIVVAIGNWIVNGWEAVRNVTTSIWNAIHGFIVAVWNAIQQAIGAAIDWVKNTIGSALQIISNVWHGAWDGMHKFMAGVWEQIKNTVGAGINGVIDIINGGINLINGILDKVGVSFRIPTLSHVGGAPGHADGGRIRGEGHPTQDSIPSMLSDDEYVIKAHSARRIGYNKLDYINNTGVLPVNGRQRFAGGGRPKIVWKGAHGDNESLMQAHQNHVHVAMNVQPSHNPRYNETILKVAQKSGLPLNPVSGYRAGSRGDSGGFDHHSEGRATDFAGFNQDALAMFFAKTAGVIELIHRSNKGDYGIFGGGGGGGILSFLNEWLAKGAGWVIDHMVKPITDKLKGQMPQNAYGQMVAGTIDKLVDGLKKKIQDTIDAATVDTGAIGGGNAGASQWSSTAAQALKMLGMPASWLSGVLTIIGRESGGNPTAINRTDANAQAGHPSQGLMQTIPSTFNAYKVPGHGNILNPLDNILAALRYIQARYGSVPAVAGRAGGYDNGGWNGTGYSWNGTGKPEMHLNDAQGKALEKRIAGNSDYSIGELHIHVGSSVSEAEAKKIAKTVRDELNKLAGRNGGRSGLPSR